MDDDATSCRTRIEQVLLGLRPVPDPAEADVTSRLLNPDTQVLFDRLAIHDRRHLVRVALELERTDPGNSDLVLAGLLHDVGKADDAGHVRLIDRILKVFLERVSPGMLDWAARPGRSRLRHGMQLAVNHASLGASLAEQSGCSARTVWLIKNHETSGIADSDLHNLMAIDRATP
jgi:predicted HD phosphohydrolase